jgi:hypothetical protein
MGSRELVFLSRLRGRAVASLGHREAAELLELALYSCAPAGEVRALSARVQATAAAAPQGAPQPPQLPSPPRQQPLPVVVLPSAAPAPALPLAGVAALRQALLSQSAASAAAAQRASSAGQPAAALAAEHAALDEEIAGLVGALKQGGLATNDTLATGNAALGATTALAERNLAAVGAAASELSAGDRRFLGYTCSLVGVLLQGIAAFLVAYAVIRVLPRPTYPAPAAHAAGSSQAVATHSPQPSTGAAAVLAAESPAAVEGGGSSPEAALSEQQSRDAAEL